MPGIIPAISSLPIEVSVIIPYKTNPILGGIMMARVPATVTTPLAMEGLYPYLSSWGMATLDMVAAEAVLEPAMAAIPAEANTVAMARPPGSRSIQR